MISALKQLGLNVSGSYVTLDVITQIKPLEVSSTDDLKKFAIATAGSVLVQVITTLIKHGKEKVRQRREKRASRTAQ